ncbi:MAG: N-acetyl-gamma-glutamyl-phosphate reductase [Deltaproteobacteria bacterium]|jgi:N-acetyl-gamma-glutamyl-phosphate reductase|nr:N-acetyl-gamma-glutamyl-phosphate reductase [Deltaproteobacteria bacterium]
MVRVGIVGATGYAGAELVRILSGHPQVELSILTSRQFAGVKFEQVYPALAGCVQLTCEELDVAKVCDQADFVFLALPHQLPMALVPQFLERNVRVVDLSADFRFNDAAVYEAAYQPHTAKDLLDQAVYGLSEIYAEAIRTADLIGNPGCYPTSALLPLIPLIRENLLDLDSLIVDSKSGVSGAGRSLAITSHYCEVNESFKAYKVANHRHNPEMNAVLSREAGRPVKLTFVPHLVPMSRGMLTTIYANPSSNLQEADVRRSLQYAYAKHAFVRLSPDGRVPDTLHVKGTNFCDIGFRLDRNTNRLILISAIDNLVKGAAGQAVQNMNIMLGCDETTGLNPIPYPL